MLGSGREKLLTRDHKGQLVKNSGGDLPLCLLVVPKLLPSGRQVGSEAEESENNLGGFLSLTTSNPDKVVGLWKKLVPLAMELHSCQTQGSVGAGKAAEWDPAPCQGGE